MIRSLFAAQTIAAVVTAAAILGLGADLAQTAYLAAHTAHTVVLVSST